MFFGPNIALGSAMACRVFRGVRVGSIDDTNTFKLSTSLHFAEQSSRTPMPSRINPSLRVHDSRKTPFTIQITKETKYAGKERTGQGSIQGQEDGKVAEQV
jgi:hypothetical protein